MYMNDDVAEGATIKPSGVKLFVIPLNAPVPQELKTATVASGTLMQRLAILADTERRDVGLLPLSGHELMTLERVWPLLQDVKEVAFLHELPGTRPDAIYDMARRSIGLRTETWPELKDLLVAEHTEHQRLSDTKPWVIYDDKESEEQNAHDPETIVEGRREEMLPSVRSRRQKSNGMFRLSQPHPGDDE